VKDTKQLIKRDRDVTRYLHRLFRKAVFYDKRDLFLMFIFWMPQYFLVQIFIPLQMAYGLQSIFTSDTAKLHHHIILILASTIVQTLCMAIGTVTFDRQSAEGASYVQKVVFRNFLNKDYEFYANNFVGSLGAQAANLREAFLIYDRVLTFEIPRILTFMLGGIVVVALHSLTLAAVTAGCVTLMVGFIVLSSGYRLRYRRIASNAASELAGVLGDALGHGVTVKSFAAEEYEETRMKEPLAYWHKVIRKMWDSFVPAGAGRSVLNAVVISILLLVTAHLYQTGAIPLAIVALVQLYVIRLLMATQEIMEHIKSYESGMSMAHQPAETMMVEGTIQDPKEPLQLPEGNKFEIQLSNVGYAYPEAMKGRRAIHDFDLTIKPGEKVGLVGYSGSGKTTLTKLLMRFMDVTDGQILVNGVDLRDVRQQDLRQHIAYVPQEPLLFHRSIYENIAYGKPDVSKAEVMQAAQLAYVDEFVAEMPNGYETFVGERGVKLSGGQRQRVAIARAILRDAPLLILDEATSALDSQSELRIQEALAELMKQRTALVIAHRLSTIQRMDRIVVIDKGKITQTGTHKELLKDKKGIYAELWAHQSGGYLQALNSAHG
jgi:ATP-binding cassette subfamily B protein